MRILDFWGDDEVKGLGTSRKEKRKIEKAVRGFSSHIFGVILQEYGFDKAPLLLRCNLETAYAIISYSQETDPLVLDSRRKACIRKWRPQALEMHQELAQRLFDAFETVILRR